MATAVKTKELGVKEEISMGYTYALGRRKESVARVRLFEGSGKITVNEKDVTEYFTRKDHQLTIGAPLQHLENPKQYDVSVRVVGGGITGQAEAVRLGIARALVLLYPDLRKALKLEGFLRRDPRMKERKKYGLKSARRAPQWAKR